MKKKLKQIALRVKPEMHDIIKKHAKKMELGEAEFMRACINEQLIILEHESHN